MQPHAVSHTTQAATPTKPAPAFVIGCPQVGRSFAASARTEGRADRAIATHLRRVHFWMVQANGN